MHDYPGEKKGPKEKYDPSFCDLILEVASVKGQYQSAMLLEIGRKMYKGKNRPISPTTFNKWCKEYPEFGEAWQLSKIISQAITEQTLMAVGTGDIKGNYKALELLARTKHNNEYKADPAKDGNTTINNHLTIESLSIDDLKYRIARSQESLLKSGVVIDQTPMLEQIIEPE